MNRQTLVDNLQKRIDDLGLEVRSKPEYKNCKHRFVAGFVNLIFWFRNIGAEESDQVWFEDFYSQLGKVIYTPKGKTDIENNPWAFSGVCEEVSHYLDKISEGEFWFSFSWVFVLPCFWTYRSYWEYRGHAVRFRAYWLHAGVPFKRQDIEYFTENFTSGAYFWMEPPWSTKRVSENLRRLNMAVVTEEIDSMNPQLNSIQKYLE